MYMLEGVALLLAAVALYGWAHAMHHAAGSPGWARSQLFASVVSLVLVAAAPLGVWFVVAGLAQPLGAPQVAGLVLLAVSIVAVPCYGLRRAR